MISRIQPRSNLPISRLLVDPLDSATYFLRAIVRNAKTNATLATLALPQISGRLYGATWQTPADASGQGFYITITTEVYTDAGYTARAETYYDDFEAFFIYDQFNMLQGLATQIAALVEGSGGSDVDYKKIKEIVNTAANRVIEAIPEEKETMDLSPILTSIETLSIFLRTPIAEAEDTSEPFDLSPIFTALENISKNVLDLPKFEKTDLAPAIDAIKELRQLFDTNDYLKQFAELQTAIGKGVPDVGAKLEEVAKILKDFLLVISVREAQPKEEVQAPLVKGPITTVNRFGKSITRP